MLSIALCGAGGGSQTHYDKYTSISPRTARPCHHGVQGHALVVVHTYFPTADIRGQEGGDEEVVRNLKHN